ncbi:MAG: tRNA 4-thiouridine(8) synthase ThiI, partial [Firmicutes bacterium]|nr:tRNA 4-thiouridine(8) synthase ThiI [Bacillota bacterium]
MKDVLLVKYGEIAIRGKNRYIVENRLIKTIIRKLSKIGNYWVTKEQGRFVIESLDESMDFDEVIPQVITVLGVVAVCPGVRTDDQGIENLRKIALEH